MLSVLRVGYSQKPSHYELTGSDFLFPNLIPDVGSLIILRNVKPG